MRYSPRTVASVLDSLGGIATRAELQAQGLRHDAITMAFHYGRVLRVRRGLYARLDTAPDVLAALRLRGRLACVSALRYWGEEAPDEGVLHIAVAASASRLEAGSGVVVHWSRRPERGSRGCVDLEVARRQAASCRALSRAPG
ncbi:hypothetical protein [Antiquaquibacter soli]|uniref:Type IV toxin-antitoxin system AbiEi family antitoxin domain-containing protein n=1 Tax=Antiquaquibacter soli TaxID=3064523 RepID=A0ABT9BRD2_9MICO|nr:hypothetical protein [Protaetiibacter sp. WY-16]MDO7883576.1 hypothetical protein [Protaetiibacter sp. WY-16]